MNNNVYTQLFAQYNNFSECLLLDYWSENFCRTFILLIDSIWDASGKMRPDLDIVEPISLVFEQCRLISIDNSLSQEIFDQPFTWGLNEFSTIKVQSVGADLFQFRVSWEDDRKIEIVCKNLYLRPTPLTVEMKEKYRDFFS